MSWFDDVKDLPFANGNFPTVVTDPIIFNLEKDQRQVTLLPVNDFHQVPQGLLKRVYDEFVYIIEEGQTYPHHEVMEYDAFLKYWFHHFVAILVEGKYESLDSLPDEPKPFWDKVFLGNFYVKPNYIGRCSHVCNAGFVVNHEKRGLGIGKELGKKYLDIGPQLGYKYSVFNLVFETNVASLKIWDGLGFDRIGYVKNVAILKGYDKPVGAIMFGKDL